MSQPNKKAKPNRASRLNVRGLLIAVTVFAIAGALYFPIAYYSNRSVRDSALAQAEEIAKKGDVDLALRLIDRLLTTWPDDIPALEFASKLRAEHIQSYANIVKAADLTEKLVRLDPYGKGRQESRRQLAKLWNRQSNYLLEQSKIAKTKSQSLGIVKENRFGAAREIAHQLVYGIREETEDPKDPDKKKNVILVEGANDADAHRTLAEAYEGLYRSGDTKSKEEMLNEYRRALTLDPADAIAAERLANFELEENNDKVAALALMDSLLKANPKSVDVRMARYRYFKKTGQKKERQAELEAAIELKPADYLLALTAAYDALVIDNDRVATRSRLDSIPKEKQGEVQVRLMRGLLELNEQHPEQALDEWRKALTSVGGTDAELTFRLAYYQIRLGKLTEARPLLAQFDRLTTEASKPKAQFLKGLFEYRSGRFPRAIELLTEAENGIEDDFLGELNLALGNCYVKTGDESRALLAYRRAVAAAPDSTQARLELTQFLMSKDPKEAVSELDQALNKSPQDLNLLLAACKLQLSRVIALPPRERDWTRLKTLLQKVEALAPEVFDFVAIEALYLEANDRPTEALALLQNSATGRDRKQAIAWISWAQALARQGNIQEALKVLEEGAQPDAAGDHASLRIQRASILLRSGRGQEAREVLSSSIEQLPVAQRAEIFRTLGNLNRELGDRDSARSALLEWSQLVPDSPEPAIALLELARLNGDPEAGRVGTEILRKIGGDREPLGLAAQALELLRSDPGRSGPPDEQQLARAEALLKILNDQAPGLAVGHLARGLLEEYRERLPEAAKEYEEAYTDQGMTAALVGLARVLTKLKKYDELDELQKRYEAQMVQVGNSDFGVSFDRILAAAAYQFGDKDRAEFYAEKIVKQLPDSVEARATLASLLDGLGKPKEAEATLQQLVSRRPNDPSAWIALVTFQSLKGKPGDDKKTIDKIRSTYKGERIGLLIARCQWVAGDITSATSGFERALANSSNDPLALRDIVEFQKSTGKVEELELTLRKAMKLEPIPPWAPRELALLLSNDNDSTSWAEAWSLVMPGAKTITESPEDRLIRAIILAKSPESDRRAEAAPAMVALIKDLPASNPVARSARILVAQALLDSNQPAEAEAFIAPMADDVIRPAAAPLAIAIEASARTGKIEQASTRLARLLTIEPKSPRASSSKAWTLHAQGKTSEALTEIESAISEVETTPTGEGIALALYRVGQKIAKSVDLEKLARQMITRWPRTIYLLAQIQLDQGKEAEALESSQAAIEAGAPREALKIATNLAVAHRTDPEFLKKIDSLAESARSKAPRSFEVLIFQATLRHLQERYEDEVALYNEAIALEPPVVLFLNNMAWTLSEGLQRPEEALNKVDEAIRRMGRIPQFLDTRGVILARLGRFDEAIVDFEQAVKAEPSATTYFHLARTYFKAGKVEEYRRCRELAKKAKFDPSKLDHTDRTDLDEVMSATK
ncbi:tetratricopeptide repeat protein [Tundrisphaera lichenicola]|uniref:tetratricopeptide repeat protein n=1 Tax=Tundrisphaera lichenicola TaxID=2029860 RepID=UPI003EB86DDD